MYCLLKNLIFSFSVVFLFLLIPTLKAETKYSYTGKTFSDVSGPYTKSMRVQGFFTTANPLASNTTFDYTTAGVLSYSFSDGVKTLTNTNSNPTDFSVTIGPLGQIANWNINAKLTTNSLFYITTSLLQGSNPYDFGNQPGYSGRISNSPGTWTVVEVAVPEPGTYATLAGALALIALVARKRRNVSI